MRVLLTEGSGLTSRQVATRLDQLGHEVAVLTSTGVCLDRFTRHVDTLLPITAYGPDPLGWCDEMLSIAEHRGIDVVFPTQEQVAVLSHQRPRLSAAGLATAVPPFASLCRVMDKVSARRTLLELSIPQPDSTVVQDRAEALAWQTFPAYVKAPLATGSTGVIRAMDGAALMRAVEHVSPEDRAADVLLQASVDGTLVMAQCVFDAGTLVAFHAMARTQEGANGSAAAKRSMEAPVLRAHLDRLGRSLHWHGALSVDAMETADGPRIIDVNPRLVEPGNALASGTDLVSALLSVATGTPGEAAGPSRTGRRTHQLLMAVLGAAQHTGRRRTVAAEVMRAMAHAGPYRGSQEELLPLRGDWRSVVPLMVATLATLADPSLHRIFTEGAVSQYSLLPEGWDQLCATPPLEDLRPARA